MMQEKRNTERHRGRTQSSTEWKILSLSLWNSVRSLCLSVFLFLLITVAGLGQVYAHGIGRPQMLNAPAGPYTLSIWTDPDPLRADEAHVVVAVLDPQTQEFIVNDVTVTVRLTPAADPAQVVSVVAGTDSTNQLLYAAEFNDRVTPGRWRVAVSADGARGASDEVAFEVDIEAARGFNWLWVGLGGLGVALVLWVVVSLRAAPAARSGRRPAA